MKHTVPTALNLGSWFNPRGEVQQKHFTETPRDSTRNDKENTIPLTSSQYMLFADIGIPCQSPAFPQYYVACNKVYIALHAVAKALAATETAELSALFKESADLFALLDDFRFKVPEKSRFPTFCDNREKIEAALRAVALCNDAGSLDQVETIEEIVSLNEKATSEFQFLQTQELLDAKFVLLSTRACAESDRLLAVCQNDPTAEDVAAFVQHAATAIVLREKVKTPSKELADKCDQLAGTLQKYHREAYDNFLSTYKLP